MSTRTHRLRGVAGILAACGLAATLAACSSDSDDTAGAQENTPTAAATTTTNAPTTSRSVTPATEDREAEKMQETLDNLMNRGSHSSSGSGSSSVGSGNDAFTTAAVDAAADGHLETRAPDRRELGKTLPVFSGATGGLPMNHNGGPEDGSCTLGFTGYIGGNLVGVTAGHCSGDSAEWMPEGNNGPAQPLGTFPRGQKCYNYAPGGCGDYALVDINESIPNLGGVIGKYRINDIVDGVGAGSVVCKFGQASGESCGRVMGTSGNRIRVGLWSAQGDSGAPAYMKTGPNTVALVGILHGSPKGSDGQTVDAVTDFTTARPILDALGITGWDR